MSTLSRDCEPNASRHMRLKLATQRMSAFVSCECMRTRVRGFGALSLACARASTGKRREYGQSMAVRPGQGRGGAQGVAWRHTDVADDADDADDGDAQWGGEIHVGPRAIKVHQPARCTVGAQRAVARSALQGARARVVRWADAPIEDGAQEEQVFTRASLENGAASLHDARHLLVKSKLIAACLCLYRTTDFDSAARALVDDGCKEPSTAAVCA